MASVISCDFKLEFALRFSIEAAGIGHGADVFFRELFSSAAESTDVARRNYCEVGKFRWVGYYFRGWKIGVGGVRSMQCLLSLIS
jgi:hypothetical protein